MIYHAKGSKIVHAYEDCSVGGRIRNKQERRLAPDIVMCQTCKRRSDEAVAGVVGRVRDFWEEVKTAMRPKFRVIDGGLDD